MDNPFKKGLLATLFFVMIALSGLTGYRLAVFTDKASGDFKRLEEIYQVILNYHDSEVSHDDLILGAIDGMIAALDDPYTYYATYSFSNDNNAQENYVGIGIGVTFQPDGTVLMSYTMPNAPAREAGVRAGDQIEAVNGVSLIGKSRSEATTMFQGELGDVLELTINRPALGKITIPVTVSIIDNATIRYDRIESDGKHYGYIRIRTFGFSTASLFHAALEELEQDGIDGLIIDVRDNGGGRTDTVSAILDFFLVGTDPYLTMKTAYNNKDTVYRPRSQTEKKPYDIVTLINGGSASASEVLAAAMHEHGGYNLIGENTFGKGTFQIDYQLRLSNNAFLHLTLGKWYTPQGNWVHQVGIAPTIEADAGYLLNAYMPLYTKDLVFDQVDVELINIQQIFKGFGYDVRTDGYYDETLGKSYSITKQKKALLKRACWMH